MSEERCEKSELLPAQCACPQHRGGLSVEEQAASDKFANLLIERFIIAKYDGSCALFKGDPEHFFTAGSDIGLAVRGEEPPFANIGWVCPDCTNKIAFPE